MSEKKYYLQHVSADKQWDIMRSVIDLYGHRSDIIVEMVKDGYGVTIELIELLYRLRSYEVIKRIMHYDSAIYFDCFKDSAKMFLLEKALGKEEANLLRNEIINKRKSEERRQKEQEEIDAKAKMDKFYNAYGLSDKFFEKVSETNSCSFMKMVLTSFDEDVVIKGLYKFERGRRFLQETLSTSDLIKAHLYDIALSTFWRLDKNVAVKLLNEIAQTEQGLDAILRHLADGGDLCEVYLCLYMNEDLKSRLRKRGDEGYEFMFLAGAMSEDDFEEWCRFTPTNVKHYRQFNKSIIWVIREGYLKYLFS